MTDSRVAALLTNHGVARFTTAGDDLWEMVTCHQNGWEYARPARRLVDRWASY